MATRERELEAEPAGAAQLLSSSPTIQAGCRRCEMQSSARPTKSARSRERPTALLLLRQLACLLPFKQPIARADGKLCRAQSGAAAVWPAGEEEGLQGAGGRLPPQGGRAAPPAPQGGGAQPGRVLLRDGESAYARRRAHKEARRGKTCTGAALAPGQRLASFTGAASDGRRWGAAPPRPTSTRRRSCGS